MLQMTLFTRFFVFLSFFFFFSRFLKPPFAIPVKVQVILLGLNGGNGGSSRSNNDDGGGGGYRMDVEWLRALLEEGFERRQVHVLETGRKSNVEFTVEYDVTHREVLTLNGNAPTMKDFDALLTKWVPDGTTTSTTVVNVQQSGIETLFDKLFMEILTGPRGVAWDHTVFVLLSSAAVVRAPYAYSYEGGVASPVWSSHLRYAVVDLGAQGTQYGSRRVSEGAMMPSSFPTWRAALAQMSLKDKVERGGGQKEGRVVGFEAKLISTVGSAVQHLILPDLLREPLHNYQPLILVPILSFHNYVTDKYEFNVTHVSNQVKVGVVFVLFFFIFLHLFFSCIINNPPPIRPF